MALGNAADKIKLTRGGQLIDEVAWDDGATFPDPAGASMMLCPVVFTAAANDNGANSVENETVWGGGTDKGTPGSQNPAAYCP